MKRLAGLLVFVAIAAAVGYGYVATQRERSYRTLVERGDEALGRDDTYAAIEAFGAAIFIQPDSMAAHLKRGEAYRRRGEFEKALPDLRRAADLDPVAPLPRELLGDVHYGLAALDPQFASALFSRAVERYRESLALDDASPRVQYKLGLAAYRAGQLQASAAALREAIRLDSRMEAAHYMLGVCLRTAQQPDEAIASLRRAVELAPAFLPPREELADIYARLGRHDDRVTHLAALVALDPRPERERALALAYAGGGHLERAVEQLGRAAERYADDSETYVALGRLWLGRVADGGRVELNKALEALQGAVSNDSPSSALTLLGRALLLAGDLPRAEKTLQQAVNRYPLEPMAFVYLADTAERRGRSEDAQRALLDYAALVPPEACSPAILVRIAEAHLRAGRLAAARRLVGTALEKDPRHTQALALQRRLAS